MHLCRQKNSTQFTRGEKAGHSFLSGNLVSVRGKCVLDGKAVCSFVHETDEAYTVLVIRGECWLKSPCDAWDLITLLPDPPITGIVNAYNVLGIKEKEHPQSSNC